MSSLRASYKPEHQFHILVNFKGEERSVAVLPDEYGQFLVVDQGQTVAQLKFNRSRTCVACNGKIDADVLHQLTATIKEHYSLPYAMV